MIYLDSSVALAYLLGEDRTPPLSLWRAPLASSRLLQYEVWNRIHARGLTVASYDTRLVTAAQQLGFEIAKV